MSLRVLITGGLGYLGGRMGRHLAGTGNFDVVLGTRGLAPLPPLGFPARLATMRFDDDASLAGAVQGMDCVVHLAAINDTRCAEDPVRALEINGVYTQRLVAAAIGAGVRRLLYVSTAHVYGAPLAGTIDERTLPRPRHPYAISHRVAEDCVLAAHDRREIEGVVARLSNGYGTPLWRDVPCWSLVINDLCRQAVERRRLVLESDGFQRRDFVPMPDVVRAAEHLLQLAPGQLGDGIFNLGGDAPWTIFAAAQRIAARGEALLGAPIPIERPAPSPEARSAAFDFRSEKLKATGFSLRADPDAEIDEILRACAAWFGR